ncbi:MAG: hypothetical protein US98_C0045G0001, partial [Parcubacteria group bacterium GW2011_GWC1_38_6]
VFFNQPSNGRAHYSFAISNPHDFSPIQLDKELDKCLLKLSHNTGNVKILYFLLKCATIYMNEKTSLSNCFSNCGIVGFNIIVARSCCQNLPGFKLFWLFSYRPMANVSGFRIISGLIKLFCKTAFKNVGLAVGNNYSWTFYNCYKRRINLVFRQNFR